jgi:hypothetical protein
MAKTERILPFERHEVNNGDFYEIMRKQAREKEIKLVTAIISPRFDRIISRVAVFVILCGVAYFGVHILVKYVRG